MRFGLVTVDVAGLYLHTPHEEGLKNKKEVIEEFGKSFELKLAVENLVDLARLILKIITLNWIIRPINKNWEQR